MSLRSAPVTDHSGIESGRDLSTWQTLKRGVELSPELKKGIGVTVVLAVLSTLGKVMIPFVVQRTTDEGILGGGGPDAGIVQMLEDGLHVPAEVRQVHVVDRVRQRFEDPERTGGAE